MKKTSKQIAAIICITLLVLLYLLLLIFAIFDIPGREKMFATCLYGTITIPILTWIYIYLYGKMKNRHTIASIDIGQTGSQASFDSFEQTNKDET